MLHAVTTNTTEENLNYTTAADILSIFLLLLCGYLLYYLTNVVHKPEFFCSELGPFRSMLIRNVTEMEKNVWPLLWCYLPLLQSIIVATLKAKYNFHFRRQEVKTKDGGAFTLDWHGFEEDTKKKNENQPIIVMFPGATGHSEKNYIQEIVSLCFESKYRAVCFNHRGMGNNVKLKNAQLGCVTKSDDIEQTLDLINSQHPTSPIMIVAFSIGACTVTNYLARKGHTIHHSIVACYLVCNPWKSMESKYLLSRFWNKMIINNHMTNELVGLVKSNSDVIAKNKNINLEAVYKCDTVWDFDDRYICPMMGYENHIEYYADASLHSLPLENISVPVLCVNTADDPLCRKQAIPLEKILKNPLLAVIVTKHGGHVAWFEGLWLTKKRFHHRVFEQFSDMFFKEI